MDGDPKYYRDAQLLSCLSYHDVARLSAHGAKVIHSKTIEPLRASQIPLRVRSFQRPSETGSLVTAHCENESPPLRILLRELVLIEIRGSVSVPVFDRSDLSDQLAHVYLIVQDPFRLIVDQTEVKAVTTWASNEGWQLHCTPVTLETILNPREDPELIDDANKLFVCHHEDVLHTVTFDHAASK